MDSGVKQIETNRSDGKTFFSTSGDYSPPALLCRACMTRDLELERMLIHEGFNVDVGDIRNWDLVWLLRLTTGNWTSSRFPGHIENGSSLANYGVRYESPARAAVLGNSSEVLRHVVSAGAVIDFPDTQPPSSARLWSSPLQAATATQNKSIVDWLLKFGAKVNYDGGDGRSPLSIAASNGNIGLVERLLGAGAEVNQRTGEGFEWKPSTPLGFACEKDHRWSW